MLLRIGLFLLVVIAVIAWLRAARHRGGAGRDDVAAPPPPAATASQVTIVACAHCGLHLPRSEALIGADTRVFCSEAHRAAADAATRP